MSSPLAEKAPVETGAAVPVPCDDCAAGVPPAEASHSRRVFRGKALCHECRERRRPAPLIPEPAPRPRDPNLTVRPLGSRPGLAYGLWEARLVLPDGRVVYGGGLCPAVAERNARRKAARLPRAE